MPPASLARLRAHRAVRAWVLAARWTLGLAYLLAGPPKLAGHVFARGLLDPRMHAFFYGLAAAEPLWRFMGLAQLAAGALLLMPRTAALGTLAALPVTTGVLVTLYALPFWTSDRVAGVVLGLMQLTLLAWEAPRLLPLLGRAPADEPRPGRALARAWRRPRVRQAAVGLAALAAAAVWLHVRFVQR